MNSQRRLKHSALSDSQRRQSQANGGGNPKAVVVSSSRRLAAKAMPGKAGAMALAKTMNAARSNGQSARTLSPSPSAGSSRSSLSGRAKTSSRRDDHSRKQKNLNGGQQEKTIVYVAGGCIAAGILLLVIYLVAGGDSRRQVVSVGEASSSTSMRSGPYRSETEARAALSRAHQLFAQGANLSGGARNDCYREAARLCDNVLASNIGDALRKDATTLKYSATKHMTIR